MPNHVHLVLVPRTQDGLRGVLGEVHRRYTRFVNFRAGWRGHLWQERFHCFVMDEPHLLATVRYVERNPVVAGLCERPAQWRWSSARAHLTGTGDGVVAIEPMLERVTDWRAYLANVDSHDHRSRIQGHTRTGRPLGTPGFVSMVESITGVSLTPGKPGPRPTARA
jgi:putative transposase